jgi:hypothetical protein
MPKKFSAILFCTLVSSVLVCYAELPRLQGRTMRYRVSSHGLGVGAMKTVIAPTLHAGARVVRFESRLDIAANLLFFKVNSSTREDAVIGESGALSYQRKSQENGKSSEVDAVLDGGVFRFKINDNGVARSVAVPRSGYDFTTMDCPETTMKREGDTLEVRLLNLEQGKVVTRKFHWIKNEDLEIGGKHLHCRVVDFEDAENSCRRWVSCGAGSVVVVRQDGKGKHGTYSLRMVSLAEAPGSPPEL